MRETYRMTRCDSVSISKAARRAGCLLSFLLALVSVFVGKTTYAASYMVTTTADGGDGSLRGAINLANAAAGLDTIAFNIPGAGPHTIFLQYSLTMVIDSVLIDGYRQPGAAPATAFSPAVLLIEIQGNSGSGFVLSSGGSTVRGLAVNGFSNGILLTGSGGNVIEGNYLGTEVTGSVPAGNTVGVFVRSEGNRIGGSDAGARNLISGNSEDGIRINTGSWGDEPGVGNIIQGNFIGTDVSGASNLGNGRFGIAILSGADNAVGNGSAEGANTIAFNGNVGIYVEHGVRNGFKANHIFMNSAIGIDLLWDYWDSDPDGPNPNDNGDGDWGANELQNFPSLTSVTANNGTTTIDGTLNSLPNSAYRIEFFYNISVDASNYGEGEMFFGYKEVTTDGEGNGSFSAAFDVEMEEGGFISSTATDPLNNTSEFSRCIVLGGSVIVTNSNDTGPGSLRDAISTANLTPGRDVITFDIPGQGPHTISPESPFPFISDPVVIDGFSQPGSAPASETIDAVLMVEIDGSLAGDFTHGLLVTAGGSTIRGLVVNRFGGFAIGMDVVGGNLVESNYVGTDATGTSGLGNYGGIGIGVGSGNTIGGTTESARNVISGNSEIGLYIYEGGNLIQGNYIGTDLSGRIALGNGLGVLIGSNNVLGGVSAAQGNVISASTSHGIQIRGSGNTIQGNRIGLDETGMEGIGNGGAGIYIGNSGATVLDRLSGGVFVHRPTFGDGEPAQSQAVPELARNIIRSNSIFANGGLGIDLDPLGVNANDVLDPDVGANGRQNFPIIAEIVFQDGSTVITGNLNSTPNTLFEVEFFISPSPDMLNHGEGKQYLGSSDCTTDVNGDGFVLLDYPDSLAEGVFVSCTATDPDNNTSEFSPALVYGISTVVTTINDDGPGSLRWAIFNSNASTGPRAITFNIPGQGPHTIRPITTIPRVLAPALIDGYSQPGASPASESNQASIMIHLDGSLAGENSSGIYLAAGESTVRGLAVSGFDGCGIEVHGDGNNVIEGNYIGTDATGTTDQGNESFGVLIEESGGNGVGGILPSARNIVSANNEDGIHIMGDSADQNVIMGNFIGVDVSGTSELGNGGRGIWVQGPNTTIGGAEHGAGNIISGNSGDGLYLISTSASGTVIQGNLIGVDANGSSAIGNGGNGIWVRSGNNTIGGTTSGAGNTISGNETAGISISFSTARENTVLGNFIGTDVTSTAPLGNGTAGVVVRGANDNMIGGSKGNVIAYNGESGIDVSNGSGIAVLSNSIFENGGLGIDLGADEVTLNDDDDIDTGANDLQNYPDFTSARIDSSGILTLEGHLEGALNSTFTIELFRSDSQDPSGYGEGQVYLGETSISTDSQGDASFSVVFAIGDEIPGGSYVSATATDPANNTSEFSQSVWIDGLGAEEEPLVVEYGLSRNYPNPFHRTTVFKLDLRTQGQVYLRIYNVAGEQVRTLIHQNLDSGVYDLEWDGRGDNGALMAPGTYVYRMTANDLRQSGRIVLIR